MLTNSKVGSIRKTHTTGFVSSAVVGLVIPNIENNSKRPKWNFSFSYFSFISSSSLESHNYNSSELDSFSPKFFGTTHCICWPFSSWKHWRHFCKFICSQMRQSVELECLLDLRFVYNLLVKSAEKINSKIRNLSPLNTNFFFNTLKQDF